MKILIACSGNNPYGISPFIKEQTKSLKNHGINIDYFLIKGKGFLGYLRNLPKLRKKIKSEKVDLIHAHYGLSGMLAVLQRIRPVIITFHGSDINIKKNKIIAKIAMKFAAHNIFVEKSLIKKTKAKKKYTLLSCGVDFDKNFPMDKHLCRKHLGIKLESKIALFSSSFDKKVKNYQLAKEAIDLVGGVELLELKSYSRKEVNMLMNACDLLLVTSFSETGPLVVKEAMAHNCPIVTTDVGDARNIIGNTDGCYITSYDPEDVASKIKKTLKFRGNTNGREKVIHLDLNNIAKEIIHIYKKVISEWNKKHIKKSKLIITL